MIEATGLTKHYGAARAVDGLSFTVPPGQVTGFLGPNGAGKSTTMRLILGLDAPDSGTSTVNGRPYRAMRRPLYEVGALLEARSFHGGRSAYNHMLCLAASNGIPRSRVGEVLDQVGLGKVAKRRAGGFSLGMGQRLGIAAALLGDPGVLLLDEPVNGLDPDGVAWIRALLKSLAAEGRTVLVSSHLMSEMASTADRLVIIGHGKLIAQAPIGELLAAGSGNHVKVRSPQAGQLAALLEAHGASVTRRGSDVLAVTGATTDTIGELARTAGVTVAELAEQQVSLEDRYMELTRDAADYHSAAPTAAGK
jgi:ABC-2 type transport system ATP-binding protein